MTFCVEVEVEVVFDFSIQLLSEKIIQVILDLEQCPYEVECNLLVTDKETIREYNKEYRQKNSSTDVLSFPNVDYDAPSDFSKIQEDTLQGTYFNLDSKELVLGDIIICYDIMIEQAKAYGHSVLREFSFLIVHSVLHLLGYDHIEELDRSVMQNKEKEVLDTLQIGRDS